MAAIYRLAHLSDPHLALDGRGSGAVLDFLLGDAVARGADHVLLTGDVVDRPDPRARATVVRLLRLHGLLSPARATVLPGNHDLAGDPGARSTPASRRRALDAFLDTFAEVNRGLPGGGALGLGHPVRKRLGPLTLVALCTAAPEHRVAGRVRPADLVALARLLRGARGRRLVAVHHHPDPLPVGPSARLGRTVPEGLEGGEALLAACAELGVDFVLHGHLHGAGGPLDRRHLGVRLRCQGTAKGSRGPDGRRHYGYDLYSFGAKLVRRGHRFTGTEIVDGLLGR